MRATCARVLAAGVMTGAIATVVGMSALFDAPREAGRALVVPPSSVQRTVRLRVPPAPRPRAAERLVSARTTSSRPSRPVLVTRTLVRHTTVVRHVPQRRQLAAVKPRPKTTPQAQPAPPPGPPQTATPPPAPVAPVDAQAKRDEGDDQSSEHGDEHGEGQGKGHEHGNGQDEHED